MSRQASVINKPHIDVALPEFIRTDKGLSQAYLEIENEISCVNDAAYYSIKPNTRFHELTHAIKNTYKNLKKSRDISQNVSLYHQLIQLLRERYAISGNALRLIEHEKWSHYFQKPTSWETASEKVDPGQRHLITQLEKDWKPHGDYAYYDATSLAWAFGRLCQLEKLVVLQMSHPQRLTRYSKPQQKSLRDYLAACQQQIHREREKMLESMLARLTVLFKTDRQEADLIQALILQWQQLGVLPSQATLKHSPQPLAGVNELVRFYQFIRQYGTKAQCHRLKTMVHSQGKGRWVLRESAGQMLLLPLALSSNLHSRKRSIPSRRARQFIQKRQPLLTQIYFMPKGEILNDSYGFAQLDQFWQGWHYIQQSLAKQQKKFSWTEKAVRIFDRRFNKLTREWDEFCFAQQLAIANTQLHALEKLFEGKVKGGFQAILESPAQLALWEKRLQQCISQINSHPFYALQSRVNELTQKVAKLKTAQEIKKQQQDTDVYIEQAFATLMDQTPLSDEEYVSLQQKILNLSLTERQLINEKYFHPQSPLMPALEAYFTAAIFHLNLSDLSKETRHVKQCFTLLTQYRSEKWDSWFDGLFHQTLMQLKQEAIRQDYSLERFNEMIDHLQLFFTQDHQIQALCNLAVDCNAQGKVTHHMDEGKPLPIQREPLSNLLQQQADQLNSQTQTLLARGESLMGSASGVQKVDENLIAQRIISALQSRALGEETIKQCQ